MLKRPSKNIPKEILLEAEKFLDHNREYEEHLFRVLSDKRMIVFWQNLRLEFDKSPLIPLTISGSKEHSWLGIVRGVNLLMAFKGGLLPDISDKAFKRARVGNSKGTSILKSVRKLRYFLNKEGSAYTNVANLNIVNLLELCESSKNSYISEKGGSFLEGLKANPLLIMRSSPTFSQILEAIEERIEAMEPLSYRDDRPLVNVPSLGKENAQERYFINNILSHLHIYTEKWQWDLTATATNVVFETPSRTEKTQGQIRDLFK